MKNVFNYIIFLFAFGLISCEPEFENPVTDEGFYSSGKMDVSKHVAIGSSLSAGYVSGALYRKAQEHSFPNILAQQFAFVGGEDFDQPLMADNLGGLMFQGIQIQPNRLVLAIDENGNPVPVRLKGTPTTEVSNRLNGPFNNLGVPGAKSFHLMAEGYGNVSGVSTGAANPYFARFASSDNASIIGDALSQTPTFFSLWTGNNDILGYATSGGTGKDQTGNPDPNTYGQNDITDPNVFALVYGEIVDQLTANGAKGVLINIPEINSIPYFTTVPTTAIPLDAPTATLLNAQFEDYNNQILPALAAASVLTQEEALLRKIHYISGQNYPIMTDDELTDISQILQEPPFNLSSQTAILLGQLRQVKEDDLIVLPASSQMGTTPDPTNPQGIVGVTIPLGDELVLTAAEQARIKIASTAYNATIQTVAASKGLALVDSRDALSRLANGGIPYDGGTLTSQFVAGGAFSLDGVHPTPRGYAYITNLVIHAINEVYDATIPIVNIGNYPTISISN